MKGLTKEIWQKKAREVHGDNYDYSKVEYRSAHKKICIVCKEHGEFWQNPQSHLKGFCCKNCGKESRRKHFAYTKTQFVNQTLTVHGDKYDYSKVKYVNNNTKVCIICPEHGEFWQTPGNHVLRKAGCPSCASSGVSNKEKELLAFVLELGVHAQANNRTVIAPQELDIFVKEKNIAVEFNGSFWHSTRFLDKNYHAMKTELCWGRGIQLIHIAEHDWDTKKEIVKSMLRARLIGAKTRIFARNTEVREVSNKEATDFLEANHLQGACTSKHRIGLFCNDELVALMTFGKPRFNKHYEWELIRFCNKLNTQIVGGASKLLKAFRKTYEGGIISYARRDYSDGNLYSQLGFTAKGSSSPNYVWINQTEILPRYKTQKHKLVKLLGDKFDPSKSENANMQQAGFNKLYDSGNLIYTLA